jgi:hypothetical protein
MSIRELPPQYIQQVGERYGTDKITHHEYQHLYSQWLSEFHDSSGTLVEIGVDQRASLHMWLHLFPAIHVVGVDIGVSGTGPRYTILQADQSKQSDLDQVKSHIECHDVFCVVDDGSHVPEHQLLTFNTLFPSLRDGGVYIIEDIETSYWTRGEIFGYPLRYGLHHPASIIEIFKTLIDVINSDVSKQDSSLVQNTDMVGEIAFTPNALVIRKRKRKHREYQYAEFVQV